MILLTDEEVRVAVEPYLTSYRSPSGDLMSSADVIKQTKAQRDSIAKAQLKKVGELFSAKLPKELLTVHKGRTYYKIHPEFAALNGLSEEDVKVKDEYEESCFHCLWQTLLEEVK